VAATGTDSLMLLRLEHAVARLLAEAPDAGSVEAPLLEAVGSTLGWDHAAVWEPDGSGSLVCRALWQAQERPGLDGFEALTRELRLAPGEGLPGRVWESGEPAWITDVTRDANFPRAEAAVAAGLHAALCFPVTGGEGPLAVVEVMSSEPLDPDPNLLATFESLGRQAGRFAEHRLAERAVRENEARLRATLDAALDAIVTMDHEGRIVAFNEAAERTFGYLAEEAIGREMAELIVPPALRERHRRGLARYLETGTGVILGKRIEITGLRADGSEFPVELTITRIPLQGPALFTGHLRDITERLEMIEELRASRARLVAAADDARRRFERDLHDGAQQRLVSMGLDLTLVREHLADGEAEEATELLATVESELRQATAELRELARGLHPAILTRHGLETAIEALVVRAPFRVGLSIEPGSRPPEAIEAAAYYVVAESLTNAARHAEATEVSVEISRDGGWLVISVGDDGRGGASRGDGSGLTGLRDRIAALGGEFAIDSPPGEGTRIEARLPVGEEP
jgi:PAS domain S-box-containing protein